jgi:nucleotide-binding universal stress UspA family protein
MSDYKTILVHVDSGRTAPSRLDIAVELAGAFGAHLACLYAVKTDPIPSGASEAREILLEVQGRVQAENARAARRAYDECLRRTGFDQAEWRASRADPLEAMVLHARYADLVVIGQNNAEWPSGVDKDFERSLPIVAGRPVLVVPYAFERRPVGKRVLVAWNASREAARAVSDALPLLKRAERVDVVSFEPARSGAAHGEEPGADIALQLARHGVKVMVSRVDAQDLDVGNQLLSRAFDLSADLIVMGAWGHSRLREFILGGVTRTVLESMTVPVLMAH